MTDNALLQKLNTTCYVVIILIIVFFASITLVANQSFDGRGLGDYWLNYQYSVTVDKTLSYIPDFLYPPPGIIFRIILANVGFEASAILWIALMIISTFASIAAMLYLLDLSEHPYKYVLTFIALASVEYYIEWDLKSLNSNLIYLSLLLGSLVFIKKSKPSLAGFLLASSVALKLYSIVLLPYLLLKRQYRCFAASILFLLLFFVLLPTAYYGVNDFIIISKSWFRTVAATSNINFPFECRAYLVSLHRTLLALLTVRGGENITNLADLSEETVFIASRFLQLIWLLCVAFYFIQIVRKPESMRELSRDFIADVSVLSLMVLPLSPQLQPHHGVVMLIPAVLVVKLIFDESQPKSLRKVLLPVPLLCFLILKFGPSGALRGIGMMITILLFFIAMIVIKKLGKNANNDNYCLQSFFTQNNG